MVRSRGGRGSGGLVGNRPAIAETICDVLIPIIRQLAVPLVKLNLGGDHATDTFIVGRPEALTS